MNGRTVRETHLSHIPLVLPKPQREALHELGSHGASGEFDPIVMAALYSAGLVTVGEDRRVTLTDLGRQAFENIDAPVAFKKRAKRPAK